MVRFIHKSVRLYTHSTRAYRLFTYSKEIDKWLGNNHEVQLEINGSFDFKFPFNGNDINTFGSKILEWDREKYLKIFWKDDKYLMNGVILEINFMSATAETEYCTEIHIVHHGFENFSKEVVDYYAEFWDNLLEMARKKVNGNWIIKDEELTLDCLK